MEGLTLSFRIVEPMMFRGPGEFEPFVRGTYSRALSLALPTPSTIAGTLATYCISLLNKPISTSHSWIERYLHVLGEDIRMKGPILLVNNNILVEDKCSKTFISLNKIKEKCVDGYTKLKEIKGIADLDKYRKTEKRDEEKEQNIKMAREVRTGITLQVRKDYIKTTKEEGGLYTAEYSDYTLLQLKENAKKEASSIKILSYIKGSLQAELIKQKQIAVKLGGETRVALMEFDEENRLYDTIKSELWCNKEEVSGLIALYLATPALFKGGRNVEEYAKEAVETMGYEFKGLAGESEALGAGYMLNEGRRKPIYTALKSGSIIYVEGKINLQDDYWNLSIGEAASIGYGTLIPVPLGEVSF